MESGSPENSGIVTGVISAFVIFGGIVVAGPSSVLYLTSSDCQLTTGLIYFSALSSSLAGWSCTTTGSHSDDNARWTVRPANFAGEPNVESFPWDQNQSDQIHRQVVRLTGKGTRVCW